MLRLLCFPVAEGKATIISIAVAAPNPRTASVSRFENKLHKHSTVLCEVETRVERYPAVLIDQWPRWKGYIGKYADSPIVGTIFGWAKSYFNH